MVICIIALVVFSILGIWSTKYRRLAKEAFDCVFKMVQLKPCDTQFDERIKSKVTAKLMVFPTVARAFYKHFKIFSWIFVMAFFASMIYSAYGIYNLVAYGSCQPGAQCVISTGGSQLISIATCYEAKIVYSIIIIAIITLLAMKYLNNKVKIKVKYLAIIFIAIFVVALYAANLTGFFVLNPSTSQYDNFAKCLTQNGATLYGAYWCPHCVNQKNLFGSSLKYINYVECDSQGENAKPELCKQNNIAGYPTWIINGTHYEGEQSLQQLSSLIGCPLT